MGLLSRWKVLFIMPADGYTGLILVSVCMPCVYIIYFVFIRNLI